MRYDHEHKPTLWVPGDWNAFFGFGTNILVNLLTLTGAAALRAENAGRARVRAHPAGDRTDAVPLSTLYYAWLAYRLAKKTGRTDVCALPSGISVPHMFIVDVRDHAADRCQDRRSRSRAGRPA